MTSRALGARAPFRWLEVAKQLQAAAPGTVARFRPAQVEHPRAGGMRVAVALPFNQRADYRLAVAPGQDLVVADFGTHYEAHLEIREAPPTFEETLRTKPGTSAAQMVFGGALLGLAIGRSKEGAIAGAAIGGMAAMMGIGIANATTSPELTEAAMKMLTALATPAARPVRRRVRAPATRRLAARRPRK
jgi:hypothetical protein